MRRNSQALAVSTSPAKAVLSGKGKSLRLSAKSASSAIESSARWASRDGRQSMRKGEDACDKCGQFRVGNAFTSEEPAPKHVVL